MLPVTLDSGLFGKRWFGAHLGLSPNTYILSLDTLLGRKSKRERNGHAPRGVLISTEQPYKTRNSKEREREGGNRSRFYAL